MADPIAYAPSYSFTGWQTANPSKPLPATRIDNELFEIAQSLGGAVAAIKDIRRSDGVLKNGSVGLATLADEVLAQLGGSTGLGVIFASQAQAEAGTSNAVVMTPLRVAQAITALGSGGGGGSSGPVAFSALTGKPTTIGGYGITDAYTKLQTNAQIDAAVAAGGGGSGGGTDTPSQILDKLKTVDGSSSGLDADLLDGHEAIYFDNPKNSVKRYGAVGDGTTDDTAAFEAAFAALGVVFVPAGIYKLTRRLYHDGAFTLFGEGEAKSRLNWQGVTDGTGGGIFVEVAKHYFENTALYDKREECRIYDVAVLTNDWHPGSKGISVRRYNTNYATVHACMINNVTVACFTDVNLFTTGWDISVDLDGADNTSLNKVMITGKINPNAPRNYDSNCGIRYTNAGGLASHPTVLHISDCTIYNQKIGVYTDDMEGFILLHCQIVAVHQGVVCHGTNHWPHYEISHSHINADYRNILIDCVWDVLISNNLFYLQSGTAGGTMIHFINGANYFSVRGNQFSNAQDYPANCVIVDSGCGKGIIEGNVFTNANAVPSNTGGVGVYLTAGSLDTIVGQNYWDDQYIANRVLDGGSGNFFPGYGARFNKTAAQTLYAGNMNIITFETLASSMGNHGEDMNDGAFVIPSSGVWSFSATVICNSGNDTGVEIAMLLNSTTAGNFAGAAWHYANTVVPVVTLTSPAGKFYNKNDVVRVGIYPQYTLTAAAAPNRAFFEARRVS